MLKVSLALHLVSTHLKLIEWLEVFKMIEVNSMYDYIVIGAGSAGSIVASKLADSNVSILLIEAGGTPPNPIQMFTPSCWFEVLQQYPEIDWGD